MSVLEIRMNAERFYAKIDATLMGMAAVVMLPYDGLLAGARVV